MTAELWYMGITHRTAPLAIRERLRTDGPRRRQMFAALEPFASGRMILSTCERLEVYGTVSDDHPATPYDFVESCDTLKSARSRRFRHPADCIRPAAQGWCTFEHGHLVEHLASWHGLHGRALAAHVRVLRGRAAAGQLLRVAAGLESRIVGEPHILGQVREAYLEAQEAGCLDPSLSALGRAAIRAGKRVRHETTYARRHRSIAVVATDWLERHLMSLAGCKILIAGSGRLARDLAWHLRRRGAASISIIGRNFRRTREIACAVQGESYGLEELPAAIAVSDAVITCTASPTYLVGPSMIGARGGNPLLLVDLAVPRNVDPVVARQAGVRLVHLDELVGGERMQERDAPAALRIVEEELERFWLWHRQRPAGRAIARVLERAARRDRPMDAVARRRLHARIVQIKEEVAA